MSGVFKNILRTGSTITRTSAYKEHFLYSELEENVSSGLHLATYTDGEWFMVEGKGLVFTSVLKLPKDPAVGLTKTAKGWKVQTLNDEMIVVPETLVFTEGHENEEVKVLMIPSAYDVRYRSTLVRMVGLIGLAESGATILVGLDVKRFSGATEFEAVELSSFWYGVMDHEKKPTAPSYSVPGGTTTSGINPEDMSLPEVMIEWFKTDERDPDSILSETDFRNKDTGVVNVRARALWKRILALKVKAAKQHKVREENRQAADSPEHVRNDFITNAKPFEQDKSGLTKKEEALSTPGPKIKGPSGEEKTSEEWTKAFKPQGLSEEEKSKKKKPKWEQEVMTPWQAMLKGRREED
jgi:hypothetical protein